MELPAVKIFGKLETLGDLVGEKEVMLEFLKVVLINAVLYLCQLIQYFE